MIDPKRIVKELEKLASRDLDKQARKLTIKAESHLNRYIKEKLASTLRFTGQSSQNAPQGRKSGFEGAIPRVQLKIKKVKEGSYVLTSLAFISDNGSTKRHKIWHIINAGRGDYIAKRDQTWPVRNKPTRTMPNRFKITPFAGWSGEWVTIKKGKTVKGFDGRSFYKLILEKILSELKAKFPDLEVYQSKHID